MNDVNNRWMQNILTNRHKDIPILFRRNLNRQIVDKQANRKVERVGMGIDKLQRRLGSPSRAWDPGVRRDADAPTWSIPREHLKSSPARGTAQPQAARGRGPTDAPPAPQTSTHAPCSHGCCLSDHPRPLLHGQSLRSSGFVLTTPRKLTAFAAAGVQ